MVPIRVAAVQMRAQVGAIARNLSAAEALVCEAFRRGAQWVILPEFFPSAVAFTPAMLSAWQPLEGPPLQLMRRLARKHDGVVGGSFIAKSGHDCFNSFLLVFPKAITSVTTRICPPCGRTVTTLVVRMTASWPLLPAL
ncbi:MAG: nitrilase-related carbon-nitrogen hydrolase [Syntrophales bacterium]